MSVTAYDGHFSFRQTELATKGIEHGRKEMSEEQYKKFQDSPFMQKARAQEDYAWTMTCERDRKRRERDPSFKPSDSDFTAAKAFEYEKNVNYYKVLGIDEYASLDDVKKAYKKLSLIYHPDKTTAMPKDQQEEYAAIFIELKNAYLTLGDQATRRQYDRDRDFMDAGAEVNGFKKRQDKPSFDAAAVLKKLAEMQKPPGKEVKVDVLCKLEKFFYGGSKELRRSRRMIHQQYEYREEKTFRLDVPKGAAEGWVCKMKGGDMNWETQPDTLKFIVKSKPHHVVERCDSDLFVKKPVMLKPDAHLQPFFTTEVHTLGGRTILVWGLNPLYSQLGSTNAEIRVRVRGEGLGQSGVLHFMAKMGQSSKQGFKGSTKRIVLEVQAMYTKLDFFCSVPVDGTVEDLKNSIRGLLEWPEEREVRIEKRIGAKETAPFYSDKMEIGRTRAVMFDPPQRLYQLPMSIRCARELLTSVLNLITSEGFAQGLQRCRQTSGTAEHEGVVRQLWDEIVQLAPTCGYNATLKGLRTAVQRALWVLREEPDAAVLLPRFADFGFEPKDPPKPKFARRRKLARPPVELFLVRNGLGPPVWGPDGAKCPEPGSETDSDPGEGPQEKVEAEEGDDMFFDISKPPLCSGSARKKGGARRTHGTFAAAVHPQIIKRTERRAKVDPLCEIELMPLFNEVDAVQLFTKPTCYLHFYSNARQATDVKSGRHLQPAPTFAVVVCCPSGAKRMGREAWTRLRHRLLPVLQKSVFLMLVQARVLLPRPLKNSAAFSEEDYTAEEGIKVTRPGEEEGETEPGGSEDDEEESLVESLARQKVAASSRVGGESTAGHDRIFDFDVIEDKNAVEAAAEEIRKERRAERQRKSAAREVWLRDARMAARHSEIFKATEARALAAAGISLPDSTPLTPCQACHKPQLEEGGVERDKLEEGELEEGELEEGDVEDGELKYWDLAEASKIADQALLGGMDIKKAADFWKRLATRSYKQGCFYLAAMYYAREAACLDQVDVERRAAVHSNRAACLTLLRDFEGALLEAQAATELRPCWGRAWMRVGSAAQNVGDSQREQTRAAWFKAVQFDPCVAHVDGLAAIYHGMRSQREDEAHAWKEKGNIAIRSQDWGEAIAYYTMGLAVVPAPPSKEGVEDDAALLRSVLHANRSAAFSRLLMWAAAVGDGEKAVEYKEDYAKAYSRLGTAQLGGCQNEKAYSSFAAALNHEEGCRTARRGREVCLALLPRWESPAARQRRARFLRDRHRPRGTTKVYALSDIHFDHHANEDWVHGIHATKFLDDVLIVTGNLADSYRALARGLETLRGKFRRVFFTPGNHEMWITRQEQKKFPDSISKLLSILELCDELDVDVAPAAICESVYVVPLFSWYTAQFDTRDPFPDPKYEPDKHAKWPIDAQQQVWRYMLALNRQILAMPYNGTVITASHFVPRISLPTWREAGVLKVSGCAELDEQIREVKSSCHVYGHTHYRHNQVHDDILYVHRSLELSGDGESEPIMCIFNGNAFCSDLTQVH